MRKKHISIQKNQLNTEKTLIWKTAKKYKVYGKQTAVHFGSVQSLSRVRLFATP